MAKKSCEQVILWYPTESLQIGIVFKNWSVVRGRARALVMFWAGLEFCFEQGVDPARLKFVNRNFQRKCGIYSYLTLTRPFISGAPTHPNPIIYTVWQ